MHKHTQSHWDQDLTSVDLSIWQVKALHQQGHIKIRLEFFFPFLIILFNEYSFYKPFNLFLETKHALLSDNTQHICSKRIDFPAFHPVDVATWLSAVLHRRLKKEKRSSSA